MQTFLIQMTPIGSYAFSGESSLNNPGRNRSRRTSYVVGCERMPPQTTVLGAVRRAMLEWDGVFREDAQYNQSEKERIERLIGAESFRFGQTPEQYGALREISGVFLTETQAKWGTALTPSAAEHWLFPAPKDCKLNQDEDKPLSRYQPMGWREKDDLRQLPDYNVKEGLCDDMLALAAPDALPTSGIETTVGHSLANRPVLIPCKDLFHDHEVAAYAIRGEEEDDSKAYRIQHRCNLDYQGGNYSFAVLAKIDEQVFDNISKIQRTLIIPMGARDSLFRFTARRIADESGQAPTTTSKGRVRIAALSPLILPEDWRQMVSFAIVERQKVRHMLQEKGGSYRRDAYFHDATLYHLAEPGSVFFFDDASQAERFAQELARQKERSAGFSRFIMYSDQEG